MKPPLTYTLKQPITLVTRSVEDEEREEILKPAGQTIPLRRPKAKDLRVVDQFPEQSVAITIALIGKVSSLDAQEVENLDAEDMAGLGELLAGFMPDGRKTGVTA